MPTSGRRLDQLAAYAPRRWTPEEDEVLRQGVRVHGAKRWKTIAGLIKNKTPPECCQRWRALQSLGSAVKRAWLPSEDRRIVELVARYGARQWAVIASHIDGRTGKQCRERWHNQLDPRVSKAPWTPREVELIRRRHALYGNRWAKITEALPGRTDNAVKNYWYSTMSAATKHESSAKTKTKTSRKTTSAPSQSPSQPKSSRHATLKSTRVGTPCTQPSPRHTQSRTCAAPAVAATRASTDEYSQPDELPLLGTCSGATGWASADTRLAAAAAAGPCARAPPITAAEPVAAAAEQQYRAWLASLSLKSWDAVDVSESPLLPATTMMATTTPELELELELEPVAVASPMSLDSLETFELLGHDAFALPTACVSSDVCAAAVAAAEEKEFFVYELCDSSDFAATTTTVMCEPLALDELELEVGLECMAPSRLNEFLCDVLRERSSSSSSSSSALSDAMMWELAV